jgi:HPr kinase/phosphorylase
VNGLGVLLTGESGVGKSECALELITRRTHCLIADDVIAVERCVDRIVGRAPDGFTGLLEVRGLGIVDVRDACFETAVGFDHSIDLCIEFEVGETNADVSEIEILGVIMPRIVISRCRNRNLPLLVEMAVKIQANAAIAI